MPYAQIHTQAPRHPKLLALSDAAWRLWATGLCYVQEHMTDGMIPREAIRTFGVSRPEVAAKQLVSCRLWEVVPVGFLVHDYADWNATRDEIHRKQAARKARWNRWKAKHSAETPSDDNATQTRLQSVDQPVDDASPSPPQPQPQPKEKEEPRSQRPSTAEARAGAWLETFPELFYRAREVPYTGNFQRDFENAVRLAKAVPDDEELAFLTDLYLRVDHRDLDGQTRTPGRMLALLTALREHVRRVQPARRTA